MKRHRSQPRATHCERGRFERNHLSPKHVQIDHETADFRQERSRPLLACAEDLDRDACLSLALRWPTHEHGEVVTTILDEKQSVLNAIERVIGPSRQVGEVNRAERDAPMRAHLEQIRQRRLMALVAGDADELMTAPLSPGVGGDGDLDIYVVMGWESLRHDGEVGAISLEVLVE